jgi:hypothetical protein
MVGFVLSKTAVHDLKNGNRLRIWTDVGILDASLEGSALSFNSAYGNCLQLANARTAPPTPSQASSNVQAHAGKVVRSRADDGTPLVRFDGNFTQGDSQAIMTALRETGADALFLNSEGGLVEEAQMVGYFLRSNNVSAVALELCASACTFALAGGVARYALETSRIGIHRSQLVDGTGTLEDGQQLAANYIRYFRSMDIDPELVALAGSVSSERMYWLTADQARQLNLVNEVLRIGE